MSCLLVVLE